MKPSTSAGPRSGRRTGFARVRLPTRAARQHEQAHPGVGPQDLAADLVVLLVGVGDAVQGDAAAAGLGSLSQIHRGSHPRLSAAAPAAVRVTISTQRVMSCFMGSSFRPPPRVPPPPPKTQAVCAQTHRSRHSEQVGSCLSLHLCIVVCHERMEATMFSRQLAAFFLYLHVLHPRAAKLEEGHRAGLRGDAGLDVQLGKTATKRCGGPGQEAGRLEVGVALGVRGETNSSIVMRMIRRSASRRSRPTSRSTCWSPSCEQGREPVHVHDLLLRQQNVPVRQRLPAPEQEGRDPQTADRGLEQTSFQPKVAKLEISCLEADAKVFIDNVFVMSTIRRQRHPTDHAGPHNIVVKSKSGSSGRPRHHQGRRDHHREGRVPCGVWCPRTPRPQYPVVKDPVVKDPVVKDPDVKDPDVEGSRREGSGRHGRRSRSPDEEPGKPMNL